MINQQLLDYIKQQLQQGVSKEEVKNSLMSGGWQAQDIEEGFSSVLNPAGQSSSVTPVPTISSLPGAMTILGQAWAIYKQRFGTFVGIMIIPVLITVFSFVGGGFLFALFSSKFATGDITFLILLGVIFFSVILISQFWGVIALLYAIKDNQERIGVMESYRRGWYKILSYFWILFLGIFITLGGFFLFVVPGIIFTIWFSMAIFVLIAEDLKGMNALLKSREYVRGQWWGVFWCLFFSGILYGIVYVVLSFISTLLVNIPFASDIIGFVIPLFLGPLVTTYLFLVYGHLRALKGQFVFVPTSGQKAKFIFVGILGILAIPTIIYLNIFLNSQQEKPRDTQRRIDIQEFQENLE